jgi:hypothetical protein
MAATAVAMVGPEAAFPEESPVVETGERSMDERRSPTRALREREEANG